MRKALILKILVVMSAFLVTTVSQGLAAEKKEKQKLTLTVHKGPNGGWISLDWDYFYSKLQSGKAMIRVNKKISMKGTIKKTKPDSFGGHVTSNNSEWQQKKAPVLFRRIICNKRAKGAKRLIRRRVTKPTINLLVMDQGKNKAFYSTKRYRLTRNAALKHYRKTLCKTRLLPPGVRPSFGGKKVTDQPKFKGRQIGDKAGSQKKGTNSTKKGRN